MMAAESALSASCASAACWSTPPRALAVGAGGVNVDGLPVMADHAMVATPSANGVPSGFTRRTGMDRPVSFGLVVFLYYERLGEGRGHHLLALTEDVDFLSTAMPLGSRIA